jgi:hypothetical protein
MGNFQSLGSWGELKLFSSGVRGHEEEENFVDHEELVGLLEECPSGEI